MKNIFFADFNNGKTVDMKHLYSKINTEKKGVK